MAQVKRPIKQRSSAAPYAQQDRDETIAQLIAGINYLVTQSQAANLGTAARILSTAKEDMVHWAVDMNFHESARERFINQSAVRPVWAVDGPQPGHVAMEKFSESTSGAPARNRVKSCFVTYNGRACFPIECLWCTHFDRWNPVFAHDVR